MFDNGPGDRRSVPSRVIPKTQKRVLDTSLLHTHHYKARISGHHHFFLYFSSNILSTERVVNIGTDKSWTPVDRLSTIWKSDLSDKIRREFFKAAAVSVLLYGCTSNETLGEEAWREQLKDTAGCFEQIQEAAFQESTTLLSHHLTNHPRKPWRTLL